MMYHCNFLQVDLNHHLAHFLRQRLLSGIKYTKLTHTLYKIEFPDLFWCGDAKEYTVTMTSQDKTKQ